jgi:hypothetical protein
MSKKPVNTTIHDRRIQTLITRQNHAEVSARKLLHVFLLQIYDNFLAHAMKTKFLWTKRAIHIAEYPLDKMVPFAKTHLCFMNCAVPGLNSPLFSRAASVLHEL